MDRNDVIIAHGRRGPCFAKEPLLGNRTVGELARKNLDCHDSIQPLIKCLEDDPHTPAADLSEQLKWAETTDAPAASRCQSIIGRHDLAARCRRALEIVIG